MKTIPTLVVLICLCGLGFGQSTETVLHSFGGYPGDGRYPWGTVLVDPVGRIYGVTNEGGAYCQNLGGCGVIYRLSPSQSGTWTESILYSFCTTEDPNTLLRTALTQRVA